MLDIAYQRKNHNPADEYQANQLHYPAVFNNWGLVKTHVSAGVYQRSSNQHMLSLSKS